MILMILMSLWFIMKMLLLLMLDCPIMMTYIVVLVISVV